MGESLAGARAAASDLKTYINDVPRLESLGDVPSGTAVLVRGDVDAKPGAAVGEGDIRLRSMVETLKFGQSKGWKQIVFGHIGRKPEGRSTKWRSGWGVAGVPGAAVEELAGGWIEWPGGQRCNASAIDAAAPGSVLMLENTRAYPVETVLWKAKTEEDAKKVAPQLAAAVTTISERIARVYVNEALSAGSLDTSSTVVPMAMDRVAWGDTWLMSCPGQ